MCKVAEPVDSAALDFLASAIGQSVKPQPAPIEEVVTGLREAYSQVFVKQARVAVTGPKKKVRIVSGIANIFKRSA